MWNTGFFKANHKHFGELKIRQDKHSQVTYTKLSDEF
jgi:hypothetical protein